MLETKEENQSGDESLSLDSSHDEPCAKLASDANGSRLLDEDEPVIDKDAALEQVDGDEDFLRELLADMASDSELELKALEDARDRQDASELRRVAHRIRGAACNLALRRLCAAAAKLESVAAPLELEKDKSLDNKEELNQSIKRLSSELELYLRCFSTIV